MLKSHCSLVTRISPVIFLSAGGPNPQHRSLFYFLQLENLPTYCCKLSPGKGSTYPPFRWSTEAWWGGMRGWGGARRKTRWGRQNPLGTEMLPATMHSLCLTLRSLMQCSQWRAERLFRRQPWSDCSPCLIAHGNLPQTPVDEMALITLTDSCGFNFHDREKRKSKRKRYLISCQGH